MYGRDPLGLGFNFSSAGPIPAARSFQSDVARYARANLSPRAYARAAGMYRIGLHGGMTAFGFEWVADKPGGYEVMHNVKGPRGYYKFFRSAEAKEGGWRFLGLRGPGGRIAEFKAMRKAGEGFGKSLWKAAPVMDAVALAFTLKSMNEAYRREGIWGAAKAGVGSFAEWAAFDMAMAFLKPIVTPLTIGAIGAAGVYGAYKALDYGAKHARRTRALEFGGQAVEDPFGTIATMRQRSLLEMQKSHAALRGALGSEAQYMHIA